MTYLVTETETDDSTLAEMYEFKMIEQIFDVFKTCDILKSFDKDEKTRDQNNVDIVASVIMRMTEYNFRISKLQYIFSYLKGFI